MQIHILDLIKALDDIEWNMEFKITKHKDGTATIKVPEYILKDINFAIEEGYGTPQSEVRCFKSMYNKQKYEDE